MNPTSGDLVEYEEAEGEYFPPSYLFETKSGLIDFVVFAEEMEQLHDYCRLSMTAASQRLEALNQELADYKTGEEVAEHPEFGDITLDVIGGLEDFQIPRWKDTQSFLVKATCLVLLSALLERGLKMLCESFAPSDERIRLSVNGPGKTNAYIEFLKNNCDFSFDEPAGSVRVREEFRKVRNAFAHGDWDEVRGTVRKQSLREAFEACSVLFRAIEKAYQTQRANLLVDLSKTQ